MVGSFIFGGDTGKTPEQVARERRVAEALLARGMRGASRNAWEGLGGLANAIAGRYKSGKVAESERRGRASGREAYGAALEAMLGGVQAPAGAAPPQPGSTMFNPDPAEAIPAGGGGSLMDALIRAESGGDPSAVSSAGAVGLTQIMPDTARDPGF